MSLGGKERTRFDENGLWLDRPVIDCQGVKDKGFTIQADRDEANINKIVERLEKGATMLRMNAREPFYGDVSEIGDLQEALIKVQKANELFMSFDARHRERFDNDPVKFVEYFDDPANLEEARSLGLVSALPEPPPVPTPPVPEPKA